eukprot:scaffold2788_cov376-Prasinococcus_capsulatus_cf.AAC.5
MLSCLLPTSWPSAVRPKPRPRFAHTSERRYCPSPWPPPLVPSAQGSFARQQGQECSYSCEGSHYSRGHAHASSQIRYIQLGASPHSRRSAAWSLRGELQAMSGTMPPNRPLPPWSPKGGPGRPIRGPLPGRGWEGRLAALQSRLGGAMGTASAP